MKGTWYFLYTKGITIFFCRWKFHNSTELAAFEKGIIEIQLFPIKALLTDFRDEKKSPSEFMSLASDKRELLFYVPWTFTFLLVPDSLFTYITFNGFIL